MVYMSHRENKIIRINNTDNPPISRYFIIRFHSNTKSKIPQNPLITRYFYNTITRFFFKIIKKITLSTMNTQYMGISESLHDDDLYDVSFRKITLFCAGF